MASLNGMGDIEIRRLREEDFPAAVKAEGFAFGEQPTEEEIAVFRAAFNVGRTFAAESPVLRDHVLRGR